MPKTSPVWTSVYLWCQKYFFQCIEYLTIGNFILFLSIQGNPPSIFRYVDPNPLGNADQNLPGMPTPTFLGMPTPTFQGMLTMIFQEMLTQTLQGKLTLTLQGKLTLTLQWMLSPTLQGTLSPLLGNGDPNGNKPLILLLFSCLEVFLKKNTC